MRNNLSRHGIVQSNEKSVGGFYTCSSIIPTCQTWSTTALSFLCRPSILIMYPLKRHIGGASTSPPIRPFANTFGASVWRSTSWRGSREPLAASSSSSLRCCWLQCACSTACPARACWSSNLCLFAILCVWALRLYLFYKAIQIC